MPRYMKCTQCGMSAVSYQDKPDAALRERAEKAEARVRELEALIPRAVEDWPSVAGVYRAAPSVSTLSCGHDAPGPRMVPRPSEASTCNGDMTLRPGHVYEGNVCWRCRRVHGSEVYCAFCHGALVDRRCVVPNCPLSVTQVAPGTSETSYQVGPELCAGCPYNDPYERPRTPKATENVTLGEQRPNEASAGSEARFEHAKQAWKDVTGEDVSHLKPPNDASPIANLLAIKDELDGTDQRWLCGRCEGASDLDHSPRCPKRGQDLVLPQLGEHGPYTGKTGPHPRSHAAPFCDACPGIDAHKLSCPKAHEHKIGLNVRECPDKVKSDDDALGLDARVRGWFEDHLDGWFNPDDPADRRAKREAIEALNKLVSRTETAKPFGPKCPAGDECENKVFLEEYEKVDRLHANHVRKKTIEECAKLIGKFADELWERGEKDRSTYVHAARSRIEALVTGSTNDG